MVVFPDRLLVLKMYIMSPNFSTIIFVTTNVEDAFPGPSVIF